MNYARNWFKAFANSSCGKWFNDLKTSGKLRVEDLGNKIEYYFKSTKYGDDNIKLATVAEEGSGFKITKHENGVPENFDPKDIEAATDDISGLGTHADGAAVVCANGSCDIKLGGCFVAGTLIETPAGKKPIETLNEGDEVITYDSASKSNIHKRIIGTSRKAMSFLRRIVVGRDTITATPGHLIYTAKGWLSATLISTGTFITNSEHSFVRVDTAFTIESPQAVYNFEVEDNHNYYIGEEGLLVHNGIDCKEKMKLANKANDPANIINAQGKFVDALLEDAYLRYLSRKSGSGQIPKSRLEWKQARDYWLFDSPIARGNRFNSKAVRDDWYDFHEINLENGKRLDSYVPPTNGNPGEIISRKATNLEEIDITTFEAYLKELNTKYAPGTKIRSNKYPGLDGQTIQGNKILEIPESNLNFERLNEYRDLASSKYGIEIRFRPE